MRGSLILCGVGGMGILKASEIIAEVLLQSGFLVRQSEVHGMAQRGGSVVTHLRFGNEAYAPLLARGEADFMLAFEEMEALRYLPYLKKGGTVLLNTVRMCPPGIEMKRYPQATVDILKTHGFTVIPLNATEISLQIGDIRTTNIVLLGGFSTIFPINDPDIWKKAIEKALAGKNLPKNFLAFEEGRRCVESL
ncbi:MAG: indolepyruvate oxidoreductase subunit beta [Candidatus Atribacteria bacterium]|nr:indolepyruvate oxidoreductase subunit beta [Candidatus Atribacteria bacterium]